jgi:hypothetical protein
MNIAQQRPGRGKDVRHHCSHHKRKALDRALVFVGSEPLSHSVAYDAQTAESSELSSGRA